MDCTRLVIWHNGALGDFCIAAPFIAALAERFGGATLAASPERTAFLSPWGVRPPDRALTHAQAGLYADPEATLAQAPLKDALLVHFGVLKNPLGRPFDNHRFIPMLEPGRVQSAHRTLAQCLNKAGLLNGPPPFPLSAHTARSDVVLLFPGAGHPAKRLPPVKIVELAAALQEAGFTPELVFGPNELESGLSVPGARWMRTHRVEKLADLVGLIRSSRGVIGADSGPLHLAGLLGAPGAALFGPTDARIWGPRGLAVVASPELCAPCAALAADVRCADPRCLGAIDARVVVKRFAELVK